MLKYYNQTALCCVLSNLHSGPHKGATCATFISTLTLAHMDQF